MYSVIHQYTGTGNSTHEEIVSVKQLNSRICELNSHVSTLNTKNYELHMKVKSLEKKCKLYRDLVTLIESDKTEDPAYDSDY